jgi:glycine/D-amino acid oxidase-like deaminating enzyme
VAWLRWLGEKDSHSCRTRCWCEALPDAAIAAGHNILGLPMAPVMGKLVAELLNGQMPHVDPAPYALSRF